MSRAAELQSYPSETIELVSREPWWATPPGPGQTEADVAWGYLEIYSDGSFRFDPQRPSDEEIHNRPGCWLAREPDER